MRDITGRALLARAAELYDAPESRLRAAGKAGRNGFASGAGWMRLALSELRGQPTAMLSAANYQKLGFLKYGLAGGASLLWVAAAWALAMPLLFPAAPLIFYAVEAQMVFLFPLVLDGSVHPFREARRWPCRAGGTIAVMRVVLPLACSMLGGGVVGRGFVRCWCLGCLAVCVWYEQVRLARSASEGWDNNPRSRFGLTNRRQTSAISNCRNGAAFVIVPSILPLKFGAYGALHVRLETVELGLPRPVRLLYASDLHLGRRWNKEVPQQLFDVASGVAPDVILLGGDLADRPRALPRLHRLVRSLAKVAPVHAVPGNHDSWAGIRGVQEAVESAGGGWLPNAPAEHPIRIDGTIEATQTDRPRLLCAHYPHVFPAARAAGYRLVLAGHLHGGQCVLATHRDRLYPAAWFDRWHGLRFTDGDGTLIVSRGLADTFPFRFNCPREVILCEVT